jgi:SAM-dependent methyltransferase
METVDARLVCGGCGTAFPILDGRPILMRTDNELFPRSAYIDAGVSRGSRRSRLARLVPSPSINLTYRENLQRFAAALEAAGATSLLVIGAGSQRAWLNGFFARQPSLRIAYSDVDVAGDVDLFCDAHELPFRDQSFDGVVVCAVLEHVMYPERAVAELHRVLAAGGAVYSEIPFLQQVHEGAYDFTRYTLSGHRRLMRGFEEVSSGVVAGPGTSLAWSLEHFAVALAPGVLRKPARLAARLAFFWLKYFDYLFGQSPAAVDGASGTFFLGRKSAAARSDNDIVSKYIGLKTLRHV